MSRFSVIVPVHKVRAYVRECMDSILDQSFADLELIAIDDCSPDGCGEILDEYALRDQRVRVLHLERNVGLGPARQAALVVATGEYVLFVDGDDTLSPGSLAAISARLDKTGCPDVLVFDYARCQWSGKVERNMLGGLLEENGPQVFSIKERPELLTLLMVVWNKAYRRQFIEGHDFRFPPGYYEDTAWTYPVLFAAERIAVLDRVCVLYRQRHQGSILLSCSRKHFDVFGQYQRVFAFADAHPELAEWRPFLLGRMVDHFLAILQSPYRIPPSARAEFFHQAAAEARRFRPAERYSGLPREMGVGRRVKRWLLVHDAYRTFAALVMLSKEGRAVRGRAVKQARRVARTVRARGRRLYYRVQLRRPIDENLAVYAAYWYRGYSCNPRAIYEKQCELAPSVRGVWVVRKSEVASAFPRGVDYVVQGTRRYYRVLARANFLINNVNFPDDLVKRKGTVHVQTQHGTPLKRMGLDLLPYPVGANRMSFTKLLARSDRWDFNISSNRYSTEVWERAFPCDYEILESGYPRNDRLCNATDGDVARVRAQFGIHEMRTAVLYAPTFRDYQQGFEPLLDLARLSRELGPDYVLLVRAHYFHKDIDHIYEDAEELREAQRKGHMVDVSGHPSVEDLCLASDVLLTDYSSIMFDYANLDRPIVIYAPDWEIYKRTRGVYFDVLAEPPGAVATTEKELSEVFRSGAAWSSEAAKVRALFRRRFCEFDDGRAAERVVRRVFLGQQVDPLAASWARRK